MNLSVELESWLTTAPSPEGEPRVEAAKAALRRAYSEPHRRYHGLDHITDCLGELSAEKGLDDPDRLMLAHALWWHDVVYDPRRSDNETQSARQAETDLAGLGYSGAHIAEVARLIALTTGHRTDAGDRLGALMVSIDLSILGRPPEGYDAYAAAVREEYAHVPEPLFRAGRAQVMGRMLAAEPLFADEGFRNRFEAQARANINREIAALSQGGPA
ncbi:MAG TPA: phosphohydrolase [Phenylobacterium sp.]|nr:phosphohydrolase [Phenylobacterium sp.]